MSNRKVIGLVPARSGSKGIVDKNLKKIDGKSLIQLAVEFGKNCSFIDDIFISTDSIEYEKLAKEFGALSLGLRSKGTSSDIARMTDVLFEFIERLKIKEDFVIVLLQPSSPFRFEGDIKDVKFATDESTDEISWFSCSKIDEPHPYKTFSVEDGGQIKPLIDHYSLGSPRQTLKNFYMFDGAFYVFSKNYILKHKSIITENSKAFKSRYTRVNIDSDLDLKLAELIWSNERD